MILNIETSTRVCSVALARNSRLIDLRENAEGKSHASLLAVFIDEVLRVNASDRSDLDAVAVSRGPGSYTGLRIGVSAAKGIAYGLRIPLIAVDTLSALTCGILQNPDFRKMMPELGKSTWLCPMLDARRMEVYSSFFNFRMESERETKAEIIDTGSYQDILSRRKVVFFGNGSEKCERFLKHENAIFFKGVEPSAEFMTGISEKKFQAGKFEDVAYFEPFYLKDFIATIPKKNIYGQPPS